MLAGVGGYWRVLSWYVRGVGVGVDGCWWLSMFLLMLMSVVELMLMVLCWFCAGSGFRVVGGVSVGDGW